MYSLLPDAQGYLKIGFDEIEMLTLYPDDMFAINLLPNSWLNRWQGLTLHFYDAYKSKKAKRRPDITVFEKRLFMSKKAKNALEPILEDLGEYLPVTCDGVDSFIFNPLKVLGVNESLSVREDYETKAIVFNDQNFPLIFKTEFDDYVRLFCTDEFKKVVEDNNFLGLYFQADLANIFVDDGSCQIPKAH